MTASRACNYLQNAAATTYKKFLQFYAKRSCKKQSFFMKLVFLPVIAFRGRGITADVFAVDEAVSLYFIVV